MTVFQNATFLSCEEIMRCFSVLVEDNGTIVYTGDEVPGQYAGAKVIDLGGGCVTPVFSDTHMHFESFALFSSTVDVRDCEDFAAMKRLLEAYLNENPKTKFLPVYGCSAHTVRENRLPERKDLDEMVSVPLLMVKYDGHAAVANSALIAQFPDEVVRDEGFSEQTGWLYQNAFYKGVNFITQQVSPMKILTGMYRAAGMLAERGVGYIHSVEGVGYKNDIDVDTMRLASRGLPPRFRIFFQTMDVEKAKKHHLNRIGGCFCLALDGCFGSEDAALSMPYDNNPENTGFLAYTQEQVNDFCIKANRAGMQITMHAIGDRAVEQALNAYEAALTDLPRKDARHIIIHGDLMPAPLQERAAKLGISVAVQPAFLDWKQEPDSYLRSILGDRTDEIIPLRSMLDKGLLLSAGSDAPCTIPDPIRGIYLCCNHLNPAQRITVEEALKMHTLWAAKTGFDEARHGSLTVGKLADFVVLDGNPLTMERECLSELHVLDTYLGGKRFVRGQKYTLPKLLGRMLKNTAKEKTT